MKRILISTILLLALAYFVSVSAQPATLSRVTAAYPITGNGTTSAPIGLVGCGMANKILSWNGSAWVCATPASSVTLTDNANGTLTINAGSSNIQDAIRPMSELGTLATASATHELLIWNGGNHLRMPITGLADFWRSNNGLTLPDNNSDPSEAIGRMASVGIGVYSPTATVHQDGGAAASYFKSTNNTTGKLATDGFDLGVTSGLQAEIRQRENSDLLFYTNNIERARIDNVGNTGIGVIPTAKLHVNGANATATAIRLSNGTTTGTTAADGTELGLDAAGGAEWRNKENTNSTLYTNNTERIIVYANGNVGIGNISASASSTNAITTIRSQASVPTLQLRGYNSGTATWLDIAASDQYQASHGITIGMNANPIFSIFKSIGAVGTAPLVFNSVYGAPFQFTNGNVNVSLDFTVSGIPRANQASFTLISDERSKAIETIEDDAAICIIKGTKPIIFVYNGNLGSTKGQAGASYSAQEVERAFNTCISNYPKSANALTIARDASVIKTPFTVKLGTLQPYTPLPIDPGKPIQPQLAQQEADRKRNTEVTQRYELNVDYIKQFEAIALRSLLK